MFIAQKIVIPFFSLFSLKCHPELVNSSHLTFTSLGSVEFGGGLKLTGEKKTTHAYYSLGSQHKSQLISAYSVQRSLILELSVLLCKNRSPVERVLIYWKSFIVISECIKWKCSPNYSMWISLTNIINEWSWSMFILTLFNCSGL